VAWSYVGCRVLMVSPNIDTIWFGFGTVSVLLEPVVVGNESAEDYKP